jgi:uncharacterized protein YhfF
MAIPSHLTEFWNGFARAVGGVDDERFCEAFFFADSEELANELGELVLRGVKRATAGSVWSYAFEGKRLPQPGDLSIVTNWSGQPLCVIETRSVDVVPFNEVDAEFAATEGEGDGSLAFWQQAHRAYFSRECARAGREFTESMLIACERFEVVYLPSADAGGHRCRQEHHQKEERVSVRLWSLHPRYLDPQGLVALWREALLAQAVLQGHTRGYQAHPQLDRFRAQRSVVSAIGAYLRGVWAEAQARGYSFDQAKIAVARRHRPIAVTEGQLHYEWGHLMRKLSLRNAELFRRWQSLRSPQCHPLFEVCEGDVEPWERPESQPTQASS